MSVQELFYLWTDSTPLAALSWFALLLVLLYLARRPAHALLHGAARAVRRLLGLAAAALLRAAGRLAQHNREVTLRTQRANQRRLIERDFQRVQHLVNQDLAAYPALQRQLSDQITRIDQDYRQSVEEPPAPPGWLEAVEAVARIPANGDPMLAKILEDIHRTLERACHEAMAEYRAASRKRHVWLKRMLPYWRRLNRVLREMEQGVAAVDNRSAAIDRHMTQYEELRRLEAMDLRPLSPSVLNQFLISGGVLLVVLMGALVEFHLLAPGMAAMFGQDALLGEWSGAGVGSVVLLLVELTAGLMLLEAARATRLLPFVGHLEHPHRRVLGFSAALVLLVLASAGALALMEPPAATGGPGRILLALALPFALALAPIPLEVFLQASRTLLGALLEGLLRLAAGLLRLLGEAAVQAAVLAARTYDLVIFAPLWLERRLRGSSGGRRAAAPAQRPEQPAAAASAGAPGKSG